MRMKITSFECDRSESSWPFYFEKLSTANTYSQEITNLLRSAWIEFDMPIRAYLLICLSEKPLVAWEKKKRDQFSWKTACIMLAYYDQPRLLSSEVQSGNEKCNVEYDRIRIPLKILITGWSVPVTKTGNAITNITKCKPYITEYTRTTL